MAYDATKYQLTQLMQDALYRMGQLRRFIVTGGSQTTVINTAWAGVEEPTFEDDDPALIYGTAFVLKSTDGLAPEGEWGEITDYDSSTQSLTIRSISASVQAGDRIGIGSPLFPIEDLIELANIALQKLGQLSVPEYVTVTSGTILYSLPAAVQKRPTAVRYIASSPAIPAKMVTGWEVMMDSAGVNLNLSVPHTYDAGGQFEIFYESAHPRVTAFDSQISDLIDPELAVCALVAEAYQWYNNSLGGANQYFLQRENKAIQDLERAQATYPITRTPSQVYGFPHWGSRGDYVPGTSDLRA